LVLFVADWGPLVIFGIDVASMVLGGLAAGMVLFIVSVGLSVTMGLMGFVNLAHGGFAMLGGYVIVLTMRNWGIGFAPALAVGFIVYVAVFNPLSLAHAPAFLYLTASIPSCLAAGLCHLGLTWAFARRLGWGAYPDRSVRAVSPAISR